MSSDRSDRPAAAARRGDRWSSPPRAAGRKAGFTRVHAATGTVRPHDRTEVGASPGSVARAPHTDPGIVATTRRRRWSPGFGLLLALLSAVAAPVVAGDGFPEYRVKAEMLFRIAEFVDWPAETFARADRPFVIAIAGEDPFGSYLVTRAQTERIHGRPVQIRDFCSTNGSNTCHLLFLADCPTETAERILRATADQPVLCVSDTAACVRRGAHVGFEVVAHRVRFHLNLAAAIRSQLTIPPAILRLAIRVYGDRDR